MKRSDFLRNLSLLGASSLLPGIDLASFPVNTLSFSSYNHSLTLDHQGATVKIHAIATGQVKVRKSHRSPALGIPQILLDPRWTEWMPVYCWVIEHPEGNILIDTGENARVRDDGYFDCDPTNGWVNKRILRFDTQRDQEIDRQLAALGLSPKDIRWVVLTHLHLDHVDGLHHFPQAEIYVSEREWHKPYGDVPCLRPPNFRPQLVKYSHYPHFPFEGAFPLTQAKDIWLIPTQAIPMAISLFYSNIRRPIFYLPEMCHFPKSSY